MTKPPFVFILFPLQNVFNGAYEFSCVAGDGYQILLTVGVDNIPNRRGYHGLPTGQVLGDLGRADKASGVIQGKRQESNIPASKVARKLIVCFHAQVMDIGQLWQTFLIDFDDRSQHDQLPLRFPPGDLADQFQIHSFIDNTEKSQPGMGNVDLVGRVSLSFACLFEVRCIDAAWKKVYIVVAISLAFIQCLPTCEDQVCASNQLLLQILQFGRGTLEQGKLVHAVVYGESRFEMPGKAQGHRRVIPQNELADLFCKELIHKLLHGGIRLFFVQPWR